VGVGTTTAALGFGGVLVPPDANTANSESWNGTAWTEVANLPSAKADFQGCGTATAALSISGSRGSGVTAVESWNGASWTSGTAVNTARWIGAAAGIQTAAIFVGGYTTANLALNELWDGSSWTEVGDLNTAKSDHGAFGTSTGALGFTQATTESWDGSSWTEVAEMSTGSSGTQKSSAAGANNLTGLVAGGGSPRGVHTEEWDRSVAAVTFTSS
jgi:hypothetical protein